jgi:N-acetylmuramoyl-L-alanine amidase/putative methionine-R-sulfoxide reductase with GAF domain
MVSPQEFATTPMSVTPTNPDLESISDTAPLDASTAVETHAESYGRSALEALLAFSALHQEVRARRQQEHGDSWQLEQFVLDEVLQLVAERAVAITGAAGVAIALAQENAIICRASAGRIAPDHGMTVDLNAGFSGACLVSGQIVRCDDTESDARVDAFACRTLGARSMVAVPLSAKGTVIGLIEAFSSEAYGFADSDVRSLSLLSELVLSAMRPEEEDRFAEVSREIVGEKPGKAAELEASPAQDIVSGEALREKPSDANDALEFSPPEAISAGRPGLGIAVGVILVALALGAALWWKMRTSGSEAAVRATSAPTTQPVSPTPVSSPAPNQELPAPDDQNLGTAATTAQLASLPEVTGIRHWSSADSSSVVIDLQDQVQYEAHRLSNPDRIYFDLHETRLPPELFGKSFDIGDSLVQRVRVAQPIPGVTRIVLETKGASNFSVSLEINPYRLVVELTKIGAKPEARTRFNLFTPLQESAKSAVPELHPLVPKLRIVLDAGHGGWDLGTVGRRGLMEKDLALDIVRRAGKLLEHRLGADVIYTRTDDSYVALEKRTEIANLSQADVFLSVHANYSDYPSARGVETYYTNTYSSMKARSEDEKTALELQNVDWTNVDIQHKVHESHRLAASVQHALYGTLARNNPGLPNRGVKKAQYFVLAGTTMPAVLAEISFVSSPTDEDNLQSASYRQQVAEALYQGLAHYAQERSTVKMASAGKPGAH